MHRADAFLHENCRVLNNYFLNLKDDNNTKNLLK
jgi:hypothetical protein